MSLVGRLQGITPLAAGDAVVPASELERKLGRAAWHVWNILTTLRDTDGETHVTHRGILRARGFARNVRCIPEVDRAMRRLEAAKLVQPIGKVFRVVPSRSGEIDRQVYVRNVWGARLLRAPGAASECAVPAATKAWVSAATSWGGARAGAGRKVGDEMAKKRASAVTPSAEQKQSSTGSGLGVENNQVLVPRENENTKNVISTNERGFFSPTEKKNTGSLRAPESILSIETETPIGTVFGGTATRRGFGLADPIPGVPLYPGYDQCPPVLIPESPMLPAELDPVVAATMLARAYRGAIEKRFGRQRFPILARGDISRSKHFVHLTHFAEELARHEISPAAWCIHRIDAWRKAAKARGDKRPRTPSLAWVYSDTAIADDRRWMFRQEYPSGKLGGRVVYSETHRKLLQTYGAMRVDLTRMSKADAVAKHFPNGSYEEWVDRVRRESAEGRYKLEGDVQRGRHVW